MKTSEKPPAKKEYILNIYFARTAKKNRKYNINNDEVGRYFSKRVARVALHHIVTEDKTKPTRVPRGSISLTRQITEFGEWREINPKKILGKTKTELKKIYIESEKIAKKECEPDYTPIGYEEKTFSKNLKLNFSGGSACCGRTGFTFYL